MSVLQIFASGSVIDSLKSQLDLLDESLEKVDVLVELSGAYYSGPYAMDYAWQAYRLSQKLGHREKIAISLRQIGWAHYSIFNLDSASYYVDEAIAMLESTEYLDGLLSVYILKIVLFIDYNQPAIAEDFCRKALEIGKKADHLEGQARVLNLWGVILFEAGKPAEALEKHLSSLAIAEQIGNEEYAGRSFHNLGMTKAALNRYFEAMEYFLAAIDLRNKTTLYNGQAESQIQLADLLFELEHRDIDDTGYIQQIRNAGFENGFVLLDSALNLPRMAGNQGMLLFSLITRIKGLRIKGNYREAYEYLEMQKSLEDSLRLTDTNLSALADLKIKYEKELLEAENQIKDSEIRRRKTGQRLLASLSFLLLGIIFFTIMYFRQRRRIRTLRHQKQIDRHIGLVDLLRSRISSILDQRISAIELRPLEELNELLDVHTYHPKRIRSASRYRFGA